MRVGGGINLPPPVYDFSAYARRVKKALRALTDIIKEITDDEICYQKSSVDAVHTFRDNHDLLYADQNSSA